MVSLNLRHSLTLYFRFWVIKEHVCIPHWALGALPASQTPWVEHMDAHRDVGVLVCLFRQTLLLNHLNNCLKLEGNWIQNSTNSQCHFTVHINTKTKFGIPAGSFYFLHRSLCKREMLLTLAVVKHWRIYRPERKNKLIFNGSVIYHSLEMVWSDRPYYGSWGVKEWCWTFSLTSTKNFCA